MLVKHVSGIAGLLVALALVATVPRAGAEERHAGTVIAVDPENRTLTLDEFGANAVRQTRVVRLASDADIVVSERNEPVTDFSRLFIETRIDVADVRAGDFVVVVTRDHSDVAGRVVVTLRGGAAS